MKQNKKRTLVTIIGIILATAMMTAVFISKDALNDAMVQNVISNTGKWHISFSQVPLDKAMNFSDKREVESHSIQFDLGYANLKDSVNPDKPYIHVEGYSKDSFSTLPINLKDGRYPEKEDELLISSHIITNAGVKYKIGDTITLDLGKRYSNEEIDDSQKAITINGKLYYELASTTPYSTIQSEYFEDAAMKQNYTELLHNKEQKTYTIVGIMERPDYRWESYDAAGYTALTCFDTAKANASSKVELRIDISKSLKKFIDTIESEEGFLSYHVSDSWLEELYDNTDSESLIIMNDDLLHYIGYGPSTSFNGFLFTIQIILACIIMVAGISLIQSAFSISISERSQYLGMLASIGATKRQKRASVYFESFLMGMIGIPLGILSGYLGMSITFIYVSPILSDLIGDVNNHTITLRAIPTLSSILITILFSALIIFLSSWIPAKRASHIMPLDAIRQVKDVKLTKKTIKTSKLSRIIFGIEGDLALKNMKRNKKRYRAVIFSLFISFVLFITVSGYCFYIKESINLYSTNADYDIQISYSSDESNAANDDNTLFQDVLALDHISEYQILESLYFYQNLKIENNTQYYSKEYMDLNNNTFQISLNDSFVSLYALSDKEFEEYAKKSGVNMDMLSDDNSFPGIIINRVSIRDKYTWYQCNILDETKKSPVPLIFSSYVYSEIDVIDENKIPLASIQPIAYTDKAPLGISTHLNTVETLSLPIVVSKTTMEQIKDILNTTIKQYEEQHKEEEYEHDFRYFNINQLNIKSSDIEKLTDDLNKNIIYYDREYSIHNHYEENKLQNQAILLISIFSYGFIILMTAICTANIFNSITTGMALRKREFAMLQSIGMTPRSFYRSIAYESLLYGIKALLYGLPISILILYGLYYSMLDVFVMDFRLPIHSILFGIFFIFAVVGLCMFYSIKWIKKENIIDTLKNENV